MGRRIEKEREREPGLFNLHVSAEMNVERGGSKGKPLSPLKRGINLSDGSTGPQMHKQKSQDGYKVFGFYPSYDAMLRSG